jgi:hypothetical protein
LRFYWPLKGEDLMILSTTLSNVSIMNDLKKMLPLFKGHFKAEWFGSLLLTALHYVWFTPIFDI